MAVCYHNLQPDSLSSDKPLDNVKLNVTFEVINEKGETVFEKTDVLATGRNGILRLLDTPPHLNYQGKRIPPTEKLYQLVFTVADPEEGVQQQIQIASPKINVTEEKVK